MRGKLFWILVGVNAALGLTFLLNLVQPNLATAQARRPSEYMMIPGEVAGGVTGIVYIVDMTNGALGALAYNDSQGRIDAMPPQDLNRALGVQGGR